jgi:uncharacterized protein (DUF362 family)/Pyruvate/2-oxoacid:ferredoxin oxidoreductase delta subunit
MAIVSIVRCDTYELARVRRALIEALEPFGTIGAFVQPGQRVLLKPNLLMPVRPERAITTHPAVVEAMVGLVQDAGGEPFVIDSPGGPFHTGVIMRRLYRDTGMLAVSERTGVPLLYDVASVQVPTSDGVLIKRLDLLKVYQEADVIISLPKFKTHGLTAITGSIKNLFGLVPGMTKPAYHSKLPDVDAFCDMLLDIVVTIGPALSVMDGVVGLEGDGPSLGGTPRQIGVLLAGQDCVAIDAIASQIMGLSPDRLPLFQAAERRGWWPLDIQGVGTPLADVIVPGFVPSRASLRPAARGSWFMRPYHSVMRSLIPFPEPQPARCTACRTCVRMCPRQAIRIVDQLAVVDRKLCIRCYCCHEICPEAAIALQYSPLGRLMRWTGLWGRSI